MGWKVIKKKKRSDHPPWLSYERLGVDQHSDQLEESLPTTPRGYVPVLVGNGGAASSSSSASSSILEKILVNVKLLNNPCIAALLDKAEEELGDRRGGVLRITCDVQYFQSLLTAISSPPHDS